MKRFVCLLIVTFVLLPLSAVELSFRLSPSVVLNNQTIGGSKVYQPGFNGFLQTDVNLFNFVSAGLEGGAAVQKPNKSDTPFSFIYGGAGVGLYYFPLSRLYVGAGASIGLSNFSFKPTTASGDEGENGSGSSEANKRWIMYWRAYAEAGFRINPNLCINANAGYLVNSYVTNNFTVGASIRVSFDAGSKATSNLNVTLSQEDAVLPYFASLYRANPIATITVKNSETAEIRNVKVSFKAGKYSASLLECATAKVINKNKSMDFPVLADFSNDILNISEDAKITGEILIEYELLGKKKESVHPVVISVYNRNTFFWNDSSALASFVSPDTTEILEVAKYLAGVERNNLYTGMNRNVQFAASIMEGLRLSGITYNEDQTTPYTQYHLSEEADFIQYPLQTLNCLSGDYDDLGILVASCLESVGVQTSLVISDDDFFVLVALGIDAASAESHFTDTNQLVTMDDEVYLVLSMANFEKGFTASRKAGANADLSEAEFIDIHSLWEAYPPVAFSGSGTNYKKPVQSEIEKATDAAVKEYVKSELEPIISKVSSTGNLNKIGVAYVRAGLYDNALVQFRKSAAQGNISGMNNLANVYTIQKKYAEAAEIYKRVISLKPDNKTAIKGLESVSAKLEQ